MVAPGITEDDMALPAAAAPRQQQALARRPEQAVGTYRDPKAITEALARAQEAGHLISPMTGGISLGEGFEVAVSAVAIDVARETYDVGGGKLGLGKSALDRISAGMGISWDPIASRRLDDGRDPRYCHYRAVGHYRAFDGSIVTIAGEKEMDLREGSPQVEAIVERCVRKLRREETDGKTPAQVQAIGRERGENQIREMRLHILGHAESKARLRAVRTGLGVRTSYDKDELAKPFLMARVMFTGRCDDRSMEREFSRMRAAAALAGTAALYGTGQAPRQLGPVDEPRVIDLHAPPPVGSVPPCDDDYPPEPPPAASAQQRQPEPEPQREPAPERREPAPAGAIDTSRYAIPGGREKGTALPDASDATLEWWADRIAADLDAPDKARFRAKNFELLEALRAEQAYRAGGGAPAGGHELAGPQDDDTPF